MGKQESHSGRGRGFKKKLIQAAARSHASTRHQSRERMTEVPPTFLQAPGDDRFVRETGYGFVDRKYIKPVLALTAGGLILASLITWRSDTQISPQRPAGVELECSDSTKPVVVEAGQVHSVAVLQQVQGIHSWPELMQVPVTVGDEQTPYSRYSNDPTLPEGARVPDSCQLAQ